MNLYILSFAWVLLLLQVRLFLFKISYIYYCDPQAGWTTGWLDAEFSVAVSIMKCVVRCWQHCLAVMLAGQKTVNNWRVTAWACHLVVINLGIQLHFKDSLKQNLDWLATGHLDNKTSLPLSQLPLYPTLSPKGNEVAIFHGNVFFPLKNRMYIDNVSHFSSFWKWTRQ